ALHGPAPRLSSPWSCPAAEPAPGPASRIAVPATVLWPTHDPLFPVQWSDRLGEFFTAARLTRLAGAGHFPPLERPGEFAAAVTGSCRSGRAHGVGAGACPAC